MGFFGAGLDLDGDGTNDIFVGTSVGGKGSASLQGCGFFFFIFLTLIVSLGFFFQDPEWLDFAKGYINNTLPILESRSGRWEMRFRFFKAILVFGPFILFGLPFLLADIRNQFSGFGSASKTRKSKRSAAREEKIRLKKERIEYHRYLESPNQPESDETEEPSSTSNSKSIFSVIADAVTGKYDAEKQDGHHSTSTNESVPLGDIWIMKPDGEIGGPFTKQYLKELKDSGKLPPGLKASRSKDGPWQNLQSG